MGNIEQQIANLSAEKRELLALLLQKEGVELAESLIVPQKRDVAHFPLSFAQQRLWFLHQLDPDSPLYNLPVAIRLSGRLNTPALQQTLNEVIRRHEILRTTFTTVNGEPVQVIAPELPLEIVPVDLQEVPETEQDAEIKRRAIKEGRRPFDLSQGPLLRVTLLRLCETEYVLLLTMHHIVSDGWSVGVLIREVASLYAAFGNGSTPALPPLSVQYADFALWQRQWLKGKRLDEQLSYWKQQLAGQLTATLELPTDRPRPAIQTDHGATHTFTLPVALADSLRALGRQNDVTLFMALLAAFQTLLYRYSGQEEFNVGSPIANRNRAETEALIGFFVNTLVLRCDLSGNPTFRQLLGRVKEVTLGAYDHQDLPFELLVEALQPERNRSRMPLFQVIFDLNNNPRQTLALPGLQATVMPIDNGTAHADLVLNMLEEGERVRGKLVYNTDLFDATTIERMMGHYQTLLAAIVANPDTPIAHLPLLAGPERRQLLVEWNRVERAYPAALCLHQWFEAQVARTPDNVALVFAEQRLTYRQLNERANQLARYLLKLGLAPETLVALYLERSLEMVVAILGILKAGGAYVPLDTAYPPGRLAFMLQDSQAPILLTQQSLIANLQSPVSNLQSLISNRQSPMGHRPIANRHVVCLDSDWPTIAQESQENLQLDLAAASLAYVIYTSGSTGKPKGVLVSHYNVVRLMQATAAWYHFDEHDVWTLFHSYAFDFSVWEMWGALLYGGRLLVVPYLLSRSPDAFYELLGQAGVTVLNQTPSAFRQLIAAEAAAASPQDLALRYVIFGGEALELQSLRPWFERRGDTQPQLVNMYGITETTVHVTYRPITMKDVAEARGSLIGRAIPDLQLYILDPQRQPVPIGVPGELYVGGAGVARGYLHRPELTAEKFVPNPLPEHLSTQTPEHRLYRTGDLARYLANGDIEYLGRIDFQVKIRGFRIELGEIEAALARHPAVRAAVVLVRQDAPEPALSLPQGQKRLVAYLVCQEPAPATSALRDYLKQSLPEYMVPAAFVLLDAFPLTANGKLDRRALPAPDAARPDLADAFVAPRTPAEELLSGIWADVLEVEQVGVHDDFFELGGHSLLATRLVSRVRDAFQTEVPLTTLFAAPTVAELARYVETAQRGEQELPALPLKPVVRKGNLPLSFPQQRLWFLEQLEPGNPAYSIPAAVHLSGPLNMDVLRQSLNEIVRRHESLRTAFIAVDGEPTQVIASPQPLPLPVADLSHLPPAERQAEAMRRVSKEAQQSFDLCRAPLLRLRLLKLDSEEHIALITMHHIVSDAWSIGIFVQELATLYRAFAGGKPSPLPALPLQYADFAAWQRQWLQGDVLQRHVTYWKQQLAGLPVLNLPTDKPRPPVQTFNGAWESRLLPAGLIASLKALSQRQGVTLFMVLLAAFKTILQRYTGQDDIAVGTDIANRNRSQTEHLIGFFVNQLVLRTDLSGNPTFRELLGRVRRMALEAFTYQDLPFEKLVEELQPKRDPSRNPLFQVMFILQNAPMPALELPGLKLTPLAIEQETSVFDLSLIFADGDAGQMRMLCRYNTDLFEPATITRLLGHLETLFGEVVTNPEARLSTLNILTEREAKERDVEHMKRKQSKFDKLMKVKPKAVNLSPQKLVKTDYLQPGQTLPLVIQPEVEGVDLIAWAESNRDFIEKELLGHGAILFRDFDVPTIARFESFTRALSPELMEYGERSSPRHKVSGNVYTSTDHPADQPIVLHNEQSYTLNWMMKLWFYCAQPAASGGQTPVASSRNIYKRLAPAVVGKFAQKQVMYMRNYGVGMGLSWQEAFQTEERAEVEAYCRHHAIEMEWLSDGRLRTRQVRPAIRQHPKTGESVWFNHALFFHVSSLEPATRDSLLAGFAEEDLPFNTYYGDGTSFEPEVLDQIRDAYEQETISFPWQKGDILMVDNMLVAHGREPFAGSRKIVVVMAEPYQSLVQED